MSIPIKFISINLSLLVVALYSFASCSPGPPPEEKQPRSEAYLSYGSNLCPDPSFENVTGGPLLPFIDSSKARSGSRSLKVSLTGEQVGKNEDCQAALPFIEVEPQSLYKLEVWVHISEDIITPSEERSRSRQPNRVSLHGALIRGRLLNSEKQATGAALLGKPQLDLAYETFGSWVLLRGLIKTDKDSRHLELVLGLEEDVGTAWFDDLSLQQIDNENDWLCFFETPEERDERIGWWRESGYGMFPIFGIYSIHAGEWEGRYWPNMYAEWLTHRAEIPHGELKALAEVFRPDQFDAGEYVRLAREAGMGHIVITAKYHDGFAMWPTRCDQFNLRDCGGFDRDILMELKEACDEAGIHFGLYYSQSLDWYTPGGYDHRHRVFGKKERWGPYNSRMREADAAPFELTRNYLENKSKPQLEELMQRYHPAVIWFDMPSEMNIIDSLELLAIVRKYNPHCVVSSRLHDSGELRDFKTLGDYEVPEGQIRERYWESLPGMQQYTYSYDQFQPFRSPDEIFAELRTVRARGGNYLLAIGGPRGDGSIPEINFEILRRVKALMDEKGGLESLGTGADQP
jgi:hypothetical protein